MNVVLMATNEKFDVEELIKAYHELFTRIEKIEQKQEAQEKLNK